VPTDRPHRDDAALRVLHVCTRYLRGGSERRLRDMMAALSEYEHDVVIGPDSDIDLAAAQLPAKSVVVEPALRRSISPANDVLATWRLCRRIQNGNYALVVTHQSKAGVLSRTAAVLGGRPPVIHSLSMASFGPGYSRPASWIFRQAERALAPVTDGYAVVGHDLLRRYTSIGIPDRKCYVIRSGVSCGSTSTRADARARVVATYGLPAERPLVAYVGSLDARKGALDIVPYLLRLGGRSPHPFLVIAGEGPLAQTVSARLDGQGLAADAALLGYVSPVDDLIHAADAVVLLSRAEGISQVLVQAAARGTPFVAYDVDGTHELLASGATGSVVNIGDVDAAANATIALLREGKRGTPIDTESWSDAVIAAGYRDLVSTACGKWA
jgi:glycosyltransferase involved in cell wall biosynthesis